MSNLLYVCIGLFAAAGITIGVLTWRDYSLEHQNASLAIENSLLTTDNAQYKKDAILQNAQILSLKTAGDKIQNDRANAEKTAGARQKIVDSQNNSIEAISDKDDYTEIKKVVDSFYRGNQ